jgi:short-subunit dehydrogenase
MLIGPFLQEDDAATRRLVDVNVHGVLTGMKLVLPGMVERGRGHLVNVSSSLGRTGLSNAATYCGSKFFVYGASEAIRAELRGTGVEVTCVMPGQVRTELSTGLAETRAARDVAPEEVADEIVSALRRPRFDVYVPRSIGPLTTFNGVLPRAARDALRRTLKVDTALEHADAGARRRYELRAGVGADDAVALLQAGRDDPPHPEDVTPGG